MIPAIQIENNIPIPLSTVNATLLLILAEWQVVVSHSTAFSIVW